MDKHNLVIVTDKSLEDCAYIDLSVFNAICVCSPEQIPEQESIDSTALIVADYDHRVGGDREFYHRMREIGDQIGKPVVVMHRDLSLKERLEALEVGIHDVISPDEPVDAITTRLLREVYHHIANRQLQRQLSSASEAALAAMRESSNLGGNVHFLVQAHQCRNLDELGQLFFQSMKNYGLNCSLQMRSAFGVKNMEVNGMARQLESDLLTQLKSAGRYFDFGRRTVVNYGMVSVLIRNMPEDEAFYGLVKDNTFTLVQGLDARVRALDGYQKLEQEKGALQRISARVNLAMQCVNDDYQGVMRSIVDVVENMAEVICDRIPGLLLNEEQEKFIEQTVIDCVLASNKVFSEGFRVDTYFNELREEIDNVIEQVQVNESREKIAPRAQAPRTEAVQDVELF